MASDAPGEAPFNRQRAIAGLILIGLAVVLMILDAALPNYQLDSIQLALVLGTASVLFGVEAIRKLIG